LRSRMFDRSTALRYACAGMKSDPRRALADAEFAAGNALLQRGDLAGAAESYRRAVERDRRHALAFANLGNVQRLLGDAAGAEKSHRAALRLEPNRAAFHYNLGRALEALKRRAEAADSYRRALALDPAFGSAHNNLALLLTEMGRHQEALPHAERALALEPADPARRRNLRVVRSKVVPQWHFPMMNDEIRNAAYDAAIRAAMRPGMHVLDIGTGAGLLAMMAVRAGAAHVTTCEMVGIVADKAREIVALNGLADRITVVAKKSTELVIGQDLPRRADLLVSEILSSEVVGEHVVPSVRHAFAELLAPGARSIPRRAQAIAALIGGAGLARQEVAGICAGGFDVTPFNDFLAPLAAIDLTAQDFTLLSEPQTILAVDFPPRPGADSAPGQFPVAFTATAAGSAIGVAQWIRVELDVETVFTNDPRHDTNGAPSGWQHMLYTFERPIDLRPGAVVRIIVENTGDKLIFGEPTL
jgi:type III protein arginine methyltransferase